MLEAKEKKAPVAARYLAERLLLPYGMVFPILGAEHAQGMVLESLEGLGKIDLQFKKDIISEMNNVQVEKRKIKEKHLADAETRIFLESRRAPASVKFS